jgi:hypothetical protein
MMKTTEVIEITRKLQELAQYHDGQATVPGYLLEQLFLATGIEKEHHYTEA